MNSTTSPLRRIRLGVGALVRLAPGGSELLRLRLRGIAAARRRIRPVRPPLHTPAEIADLSVAADDHPFITGNRLAARCRYVINFDDLIVNREVDNNWWFCRSEFIEYFFANHEPDDDYVLFSSNSDRPIDGSLRRFLRRRKLRAWFAVNVEVHHPKLHAFPRGLADARWRHGDGAALARIQRHRLEKQTLFDASYDISTYPPAREYCRDETGIEPAPRREYEPYLRRLASSYFCIAPRGNGLDTHRVWEALYLRTVPIVTRSVLVDQHTDLPIVTLDDWSEFRREDFTPELYHRLMDGWNPDTLELHQYLGRVGATLDHGV